MSKMRITVNEDIFLTTYTIKGYNLLITFRKGVDSSTWIILKTMTDSPAFNAWDKHRMKTLASLYLEIL